MSGRRSFRVFIVASLLLAGTSALALQYLGNVRLRHRLEQRERSRPDAPMRAENARLQVLLRSDPTDLALQSKVVQARAEVTDLERKAHERYLQRIDRSAREANSLATNHDPSRGMVRVENLQNRGQATPTTALETLAWAALHGDDDALARASFLPTETRDRAQALIARLPEEAKAAWTTEKLAMLWVSQAVLELPAMEVTSETTEDATHATVKFRTLGNENEETVQFTLTPNGWSVIIPAKAIDKLASKLRPSDPNHK